MSHLNAQIVRLYDTVFDRDPDAEGLEFWNGATHRELTLNAMADLFITAPEFASTYDQPDNLSFVQAMYQNILDRPGEADGVAFWTRVLDEGLADRGDVVIEFSESPEHIAQMENPPAEEPPPPNNSQFGDDTIIGDDFRIDVIYGDTSGDITEGRGGNDQIFGRGGSFGRGQGDSLYGDAENLRGTARGGDDLIDGGTAGDLLHGDAASQISDNASGGNDSLFGGPGDDTARGDALRLSGNAWGGNDLLDGGEGNDILYGDATFLADGSRGGDDRLDGGAGDDTLWGDAQFLTENATGGRDTFVFTGAFGDDRALDFRRGEDRIEFAVPDRDPFDLRFTNDPSGTVITLEGFGSVTLVGYTGGLSGSDVFFV